jgi:nucleotide-sensitive chloride channel 1A
MDCRNLTLFQTTPTSTGVEIPYMNLSLNDPETVNEEEDIQTLELTILPPSYATNPDTACIKEIFNAMNTCADLHPDGDASGDEDGEDILDDTAPGASGWITAENMDEYMDENGNFTGMVIGNDELGPGAGTVRTREDTDQGTNGVNGDGHEEKYHRTG